MSNYTYVSINVTLYDRCVGKKFKYTNYLVNKVVICANELSVCKTFRDKRENTPIAIIKEQYKSHKHKMMHLIQILR